MDGNGRETPESFVSNPERTARNPRGTGNRPDGPGLRPARSMGRSLRERFARAPGNPGAPMAERAPREAGGPVSPGCPAWMTESVRSWDVVEIHESVRGALVEPGAGSHPVEAGTAGGVAGGDDHPRPAGGFMEPHPGLHGHPDRGAPDGDAPDVLPDGDGGLQALSRLREGIARPEGLAGAAFRQSILEIISEVARLHGRAADEVLARIDIEHNLPSPRTAFLCGLIIAETVSGCLGHLGRTPPVLRVNVTFRHTGAGKLLLSVRVGSDGRPRRAWPAGAGPSGPESPGPAAGRLRGELERDGSGGADFRVIFCEGGRPAP